MPLLKSDLDQLKAAKDILENPGIAAKLSAVVGSPIEKGLKLLPKRMQGGVQKATQSALLKALDVAVTSLGRNPAEKPSKNRLHKFAAAA
jgi:hypothetical protein